MKECTWCDTELIRLLDDIKLSAFTLRAGDGEQGCLRTAEQKHDVPHNPVSKKSDDHHST